MLCGLGVPSLRSLWGAVRNRQLYILRMYCKGWISFNFSIFFYNLHDLQQKKKNYTTYSKKKNSIFFYNSHDLQQKKKITRIYSIKKKITRLYGFFVHDLHFSQTQRGRGGIATVPPLWGRRVWRAPSTPTSGVAVHMRSIDRCACRCISRCRCRNAWRAPALRETVTTTTPPSTGRGGGGVRKRRNLEWQTLAQQKCTKFLPRYFEDRGHFSTCRLWRSWDAPPPGRNSKRPEANSRGVSSFLCHNLRLLCQILRWYLRSGATFSLHQISASQTSHVPNPPPPPARRWCPASCVSSVCRRTTTSPS